MSEEPIETEGSSAGGAGAARAKLSREVTHPPQVSPPGAGINTCVFGRLRAKWCRKPQSFCRPMSRLIVSAGSILLNGKQDCSSFRFVLIGSGHLPNGTRLPAFRKPSLHVRSVKSPEDSFSAPGKTAVAITPKLLEARVVPAQM